MAAEVKKEIELEIAYVLFIDIVGSPKLLINEQRRLLRCYQIVKGTDQFRTAEANGRLLPIPTGDGMALVFYNTPEAPVECAFEIGRADKAHPERNLRMGVHSGPISGVLGVTGRANVAGAAINIACLLGVRCAATRAPKKSLLRSRRKIPRHKCPNVL